MTSYINFRLGFKPYLSNLVVCVCVCRPSARGVCSWKHVQSCLYCSIVTKGGSYWPFFIFFQKFLFWAIWWPFLGDTMPQILRLKMRSLGTLEEGCQFFWQSSDSNCPKWTCKFYFLEMWGYPERRRVVNTHKDHFLFSNFHKIWGNLLLAGPRKNLRHKMGLLGALLRGVLKVLMKSAF